MCCVKFSIYLFLTVVISCSLVSSLNRHKRQFPWNDLDDESDQSTSTSTSTTTPTTTSTTTSTTTPAPTSTSTSTTTPAPTSTSTSTTTPAPTSTSTTTTTPVPTTRPTVSLANFYSCMGGCGRTSEYNPVCGNDGTTYHNNRTLYCANFCGRRVQFVRSGTCTVF